MAYYAEYEIIIEEKGDNPEIFITDELGIVQYVANYAGRTNKKITITPLKMKENK